MKNDIVEFIPVGMKNAKSSEELGIMTNLSPREIRFAVFEGRCRGVPICSSEAGYWIAANKEEAMIYYRAQMSRIMTGFAALNPIKKFIINEGAREDWEIMEEIERNMHNAVQGYDDTGR